MKIDFFGSSLVSSYWNGAATYYRGLLKALARLGHTITFYEPDAFERQQHRDIPDPDWARVVIYPATEDGWRRALDRARAEADLLVKASGVGVFDRELEEAVPSAARNGCHTVYWDVDAPATLDTMARDTTHHLRRVIPDYDLVLTYGGGAPVSDAYRRWGARDCVPIYNALDPETHYPVPANTNYICDLNFLGNRLPDREARVEEFLLRAATARPRQRFTLAGAGWNDKAIPGNVQVRDHVPTADHNAFFCSALATLNVNRDSMARYGFSPPTRIFEAAGAGACIISDAWEGIAQFLEPDHEILVAADGNAVAEHLDRLTPIRARTIGAAALERVLAEHTYTHRARQVAELLDTWAYAEEAAE